MAEKRYYWLKLKNTYFKQLNQVKMRQQKHGKDMQIIYLKMMLHSLDNEGEICYEGVFGSLAEEIALKINEETEIVEETLEYLKDNGMVTILSNDLESIAIPETIECTGSESYSTERSRRCREKKRCNATDMQQSATDVQQGATHCNQEKEREKEREKEIDIEREKEKERCNATDMQQSATHCNQGEKKREPTPYQEIIDMYNRICTSLPRVNKLSEARKKAISARYRQYSINDFEKLFEMAEGSSFLKGKNERNWIAPFDWLIKDANMAKVLDGNYIDRENQKKQGAHTKPYQQFNQREYDNRQMDELERRLLNNGNRVQERK